MGLIGLNLFFAIFSDDQLYSPTTRQAEARGRRLPFGVAWAAGGAVAGAVVVRGDGARAGELIRPSMDNTDMYNAMRAALFGERMKAR